MRDSEGAPRHLETDRDRAPAARGAEQARGLPRWNAGGRVARGKRLQQQDMAESSRGTCSHQCERPGRGKWAGGVSCGVLAPHCEVSGVKGCCAEHRPCRVPSPRPGLAVSWPRPPCSSSWLCGRVPCMEASCVGLTPSAPSTGLPGWPGGWGVGGRALGASFPRQGPESAWAPQVCWDAGPLERQCDGCGAGLGAGGASALIPPPSTPRARQEEAQRPEEATAPQETPAGRPRVGEHVQDPCPQRVSAPARAQRLPPGVGPLPLPQPLSHPGPEELPGRVWAVRVRCGLWRTIGRSEAGPGCCGWSRRGWDLDLPRDSGWGGHPGGGSGGSGGGA